MPIRRWYGTQKFDIRVETETHDTFDVHTPFGRYRVRPSRHGKGCFALQNMEAKQCVGVYPGQIINERQLYRKMGLLPHPQQEKVYRHLVQSKIHSTEKSPCYLDPTDNSGALDRSWVHNPILYVNEPDRDQKQNLIPVWNYDTSRLELWTARWRSLETTY